MKVNQSALTVAFIGALAISAEASAENKGRDKGHHLSFTQADANADGELSVFEFAKTGGPGTPLVEVRRRFLPYDVSGEFEEITNAETGEVTDGDPIPDGFLSAEEFEAFKTAEDREKSDLSKFDLADFDGDGVLTPDEFSHLASPKKPLSKVLKKFTKRDADDNGELSREELVKEDDDA